jgi:hypothetical protein
MIKGIMQINYILVVVVLCCVGCDKGDNTLIDTHVKEKAKYKLSKTINVEEITINRGITIVGSEIEDFKYKGNKGYYSFAQEEMMNNKDNFYKFKDNLYAKPYVITNDSELAIANKFIKSNMISNIKNRDLINNKYYIVQIPYGGATYIDNASVKKTKNGFSFTYEIWEVDVAVPISLAISNIYLVQISGAP